MNYGLLGPLRVTDGEREIALPRPKDRSVLAFLLLHAREVVSLDRLLDELWGERPPPTAKNSLQNSVSRLRKLLGADVLRTRPPGYLLDVPDEDVDVACFERLVREAFSSGIDGSVRMYRCEICGRLPQLVALAEQRLAGTGRTLTPRERRKYLHD